MVVSYFLIPGLSNLAQEDWSGAHKHRFFHLDKFFNHSIRESQKCQSFDESLCQILNLNHPVFPLNSWLNFKQKNNLLATPIQLKTDINSTWAHPVSTQLFFDDILHDMADYFQHDLSLMRKLDQHYVIQFKQTTPMCELPHYLAILGKKINPYSDLIKQHLEWFKLINEIQMYLHAHPKNQAQNGLTYFNSLWFWGGEAFTKQSLNYQIHSDDLLFQNVNRQAATLDNQLFVYLDAIKYLKQNAPFDLFNFFKTLNEQIATLNLKNVVFDDGHGQIWRYSATRKWQFWAKHKPLQQHLTADLVP